MFGLGEKASAPVAAVKDATEASFMTDVIDASQEAPVIVDFWAPWCGPCKTLTPALEAAVAGTGGKVRMVKIDVDQNQRIAAQLRIQSIPTVYAFWQGQPVDGFQGALPGSEVKKFVDRVAAILGEDADNAPAYAGLIRSHLALGQIDQAQGLADAAPAAIAKAKEIEAARAQIELARQAANAGPVGELRAAVAADPADLQARFDLALALHANGKVEEAVDELLELFRRDREWKGGAARAQLFTIFEALKPTDPVVLKGRRKLSSMIFA
jgi:putative thioredoxin